MTLKPLNFRKQFSRLGKKLRPLARHHYFISTLAVLLSLIAAVYIMTQTLNAPGDDNYRSQKESEGIRGNFDQSTIDKIERLQKSSDQPAAQPTIPPGTRTNPFAE